MPIIEISEKTKNILDYYKDSSKDMTYNDIIYRKFNRCPVRTGDVIMNWFKDLLKDIEMHDSAKNYDVRNNLIWELLAVAKHLNFECGIRIPDDCNPEEWLVVYIILPNVGQVAWHVPNKQLEYDGHTTKEKYERIKRFFKYDICSIRGE